MTPEWEAYKAPCWFLAIILLQLYDKMSMAGGLDCIILFAIVYFSAIYSKTNGNSL